MHFLSHLNYILFFTHFVTMEDIRTSHMWRFMQEITRWLRQSLKNTEWYMGAYIQLEVLFVFADRISLINRMEDDNVREE